MPETKQRPPWIWHNNIRNFHGSDTNAPANSFGRPGNFWLRVDRANNRLMVYGPKLAGETGVSGPGWSGPWPVMILNADATAGHTGATGATGSSGLSFTWRGEWNSATAYAARDAVFYNGASFMAKASTTNEIPPNTPAKWDLMAAQGGTGPTSTVPGPVGASGATGPTSTVPGPPGDSFAWLGEWNAGTSYNVRQAVAYSGASWMAKEFSLNIAPGSNATKWDLMADRGGVGYTGPASTVPGPVGATGAASTIPGATGATGVGATGATGVGLVGNTGATGVGATGATGVGVQGATGVGAVGATGAAGTSFSWLSEWNSGTTYQARQAVAYSGASWMAKEVSINVAPPNATKWDLMADKGGVGFTGATGPAGERGFTGVGAVGATGATGVGATGAAGEAGRGYNFRGAYNPATTYSRDDAVTYLGESWRVLALGLAGITPVEGAQWEKIAAKGGVGFTGATGVGAVGATGATGVGAVGATGVGAVGATGATGVGAVGNTGATGPASTVPGHTGATGPASTVPGATGAAGLSFTWRGAWDGGTTYSVRDAVSYSGASWMAKEVSINVAPPNATKWDLMADKGSVGFTGATGVGATGATGAAGGVGATGVGNTGATGPAGERGFTGVGSVGATGATGVGATGATGVGATGATGVGFNPRGTFVSVETYAVNDIVQHLGETWRIKFNGVPTVSPPVEGPAFDRWAQRGGQGFTGATGPSGQQGATGVGLVGATGAAGKSFLWRGEWNSGFNYAACDAVAYSGASWMAKEVSINVAPPSNATKWDLMADKGGQGFTGATGPAGERGYTGVGSVGATGATGVGNTGATGPTGERGFTGVGTVGATGATGVGATGATGVGATGATGPLAYVHRGTWNGGSSYNVPDVVTHLGETFRALEFSQNVPPIKSGNSSKWELMAREGGTGPTGPAGGVGATGVGLVGNTGATGPPGAAAAQGFTGATGPAGERGYTGIGVQGATGATGVGNTGATGPAGERGFTGVGSVGATGATGVGATGATGPLSYNHRGAWDSAPSYNVPDVVTHLGETFRARELSVNVAPTRSATSTKWELMAREGGTGPTGPGFSWRSEWNSGTAYGVREAVTYSGASWMSKASTTNEAPPLSPSKWDLMARGLYYVDTWVNSATYNKGDVTGHGGSSYVSRIDGNTNVIPGSDGSKWAVLALKGNDSTVPGPTGPQGATGVAGGGAVWITGAGAPGSTGAAGQFYMDTATKNVYYKDGSGWH